MIKQHKIAFLMILVVLTASSGLYYYWGAYDQFIHVKAYRTISTRMESIVENKDLTVGEVLTRLSELSDDISGSHKGLAKLGEIYMELGRYHEAIANFEKAIALSPASLDYQLQWIYLESFIHQGKLPSLARSRAEKLLEDPANRAPSMNILAMDDYFRGNHEKAIGYWEELLQTDPSLSPERRAMLEKAITHAKAKR